MVSLSTLIRWSATAALAATIITACSSKPQVIPKEPKEPCFTTCMSHMKRCQALCSEANEECAGNAKYIADLKASHVHAIQKTSTSVNKYLHIGQCNSNCGCVPSKKVCYDLCQYAAN